MKLNVLSLFDGLSGGRVALARAGIKVNNYFASEIDKHAIRVAMYNYPDTVHLGDIKNWSKWDLPQIDLIIGGSPCQSFSFAGRRNGMSAGDIEVTSLEQYEQLKRAGYEFDGQSYLFWEYAAVLRHYQPRWFLLENVVMSKKWQHVVSGALGIEPMIINSELVSAQRRRRLYWTNIHTRTDMFGHLYTAIPRIKNHHIYLADILDHSAPHIELKSIRKKSKTLRVGGRNSYDRHEWDSVDDNHARKLTVLECERLQTLPDGYTNVPGVSMTQRYKMIGNGWTIDVIAHILSFLKYKTWRQSRCYS